MAKPFGDDGKEVLGLWRGRVRNAERWAAIREKRAGDVALARAWAQAARDDGWRSAPLYAHEAEERAARLTRSGFVIHVLSRDGDDNFLPTAEVSIWGPDGAAIDPPLTYSFDAIERGLKTCGECKAYPVETAAYAFANRCCATCGPEFMRKLPRNWAD